MNNIASKLCKYLCMVPYCAVCVHSHLITSLDGIDRSVNFLTSRNYLKDDCFIQRVCVCFFVYSTVLLTDFTVYNFCCIIFFIFHCMNKMADQGKPKGCKSIIKEVSPLSILYLSLQTHTHTTARQGNKKKVHLPRRHS